jgi:hypothetical protein
MENDPKKNSRGKKLTLPLIPSRLAKMAHMILAPGEL